MYVNLLLSGLVSKLDVLCCNPYLRGSFDLHSDVGVRVWSVSNLAK